jgi:hypothetical protein
MGCMPCLGRGYRSRLIARTVVHEIVSTRCWSGSGVSLFWRRLHAPDSGEAYFARATGRKTRLYEVFAED